MEFHKGICGNISVSTLFAFGVFIFFYVCGFILPIMSIDCVVVFYIVDNMKLILYDISDFLFIFAFMYEIITKFVAYHDPRDLSLSLSLFLFSLSESAKPFLLYPFQC